MELLKRKPPKLAADALANKNARVVWKLIVSGERYKPARNATIADRERRRATLAEGLAPRRSLRSTPPQAHVTTNA